LRSRPAGAADLVALGGGGEFVDRRDQSRRSRISAPTRNGWNYRRHCDRLFFATTLEVPCEIFPKDTGLIVADASAPRSSAMRPGAPPACREPASA